MKLRPIDLPFVAVSLAAAAVLAYGFGHNLSPVTITKILTFFVVPALAAILGLAAIRLSRDAKLTLIAIGVAAVVAIYGYQAWMLWTPGAAQSDAEAPGKDFDRRDRRQVVLDMRAQGKDAYPSLLTKHFVEPMRTSSGSYYPLAGIPHVLTVHCNESGIYTTYHADEYGFNNPPGTWSLTPADAVLIGDSFVHGACVSDADSIAGHVRARLPATFNLGMGGRGPLIELGTFLEYAVPLRPRHVVWFYYDDNDLVNLAAERHVREFMAYLRSGEPHQKLMARRDELAAGQKDFIERELRAEAIEASRRQPLINQLMLRPLRERLGLNFAGIVDIPAGRDERRLLLPLLADILTVTRDKAATWGGTVTFVYLPDYGGLLYPGESSRPEVLETVRRLGIPVVDLTDPFRAHPDPLKALWFYPGSHYTPEGYRLVANHVLGAIHTGPTQ